MLHLIKSMAKPGCYLREDVFVLSLSLSHLIKALTQSFNTKYYIAHSFLAQIAVCDLNAPIIRMVCRLKQLVVEIVKGVLHLLPQNYKCCPAVTCNRQPIIHFDWDKYVGTIDIEYNKSLDRRQPCLTDELNGGSNNIVQSNKSVWHRW